MLSLIISLFTLIPTSNASSHYMLPKDAVSVSPAVHDSVTFGELCPADMQCLVNGTSVRLKYTLNGCLNQFLPVQYSLQKIEGRNVLFLTALEVETRGSMTAKCVRAPVALVQIPLINVYEPVEIVYVNRSAKSVVK